MDYQQKPLTSSISHLSGSVDKTAEKFLDGIMPKTSSSRQNRQYAATHVALTARMLKGLHKSIDNQMELARDLEVDHALALLESGQAKLIDHDEMIRQARKRIG